MARSASIISDSDGNARDASEPVNDKVSDGERENVEGEGEGEGEGEDDEEEYEIEEILKHQRGMFDKGKMGYLCKWKGYGPEHNSWVNEDDAENATETIEAYWNKVNAKKKPRKSTDQITARKSRRSSVADSPEPVSALKKRGRKSVANDEDVEQDEEEQNSKRQKTKTMKESQSTEPDNNAMDVDEAEAEIADVKYMKKFMSRTSWEDIVDTIDTVERPSYDGPLLVYFRLKQKQGGTRVRLDSKLCREKFPQALLDFYESNLKWKETEVDDDAPLS